VLTTDLFEQLSGQGGSDLASQTTLVESREPLLVPWGAKADQPNQLEADSCGCGCSGVTPK
jgi:hypothetical protein